MLKKFAFFLVLYSTIVFADDIDDISERLSIVEKESQMLLNRIEILERKLKVNDNGLSNSLIKKEHIKSLINNEQELDVFEILDSIDKTTQKVNSANVASKSPKLTEENMYILARKNLDEKKFYEAELKFSEFIKTYPNSKNIANAYFAYAETFFHRQIYEKAAVNYLKAYKINNKGPKAADSLLKTALSLGNLKKMKEACGILDKIKVDFPNQPDSLKKAIRDAKAKFSCSN